jgi:hypothetical protein
MLDHRPAGDVEERLAGKPCGGVSGWDDGDNKERRRGVPVGSVRWL